jgi:hypothetical protein
LAELFITCILHCCTQVQTPNGIWNEQDREALRQARNHCADESECLTKFTKAEDGIYTAICGEENN